MGVNYRTKGHIAYVELDRPEARNALDPITLIELYEAWQAVRDDSDVRVALLSSAVPDIFCAGMDLKSTMPLVMRIRGPQN